MLDLLTRFAPTVIASVTNAVPDSGVTALLLGGGVLALGLVARFLKNRKK